MAQIVNSRDLTLQTVSPRVATTSMSSNLTVDPSQVTGLGLVIAGTKMVFLEASTQVFQIAKSGTVSPASTVLTAQVKNLTNTPTLVVVSGTITPTPVLASGVVTVVYADMKTDVATIRLTVVQDSVTYTDEVTIVKVREGIDGLVGFLTNEAHTVPADYLGNVTSYAGAGGTLKVFQGITDITNLCTFSIPAGGNTSGLTASINATTGVYAITNTYPTNVDIVTLTVRATFGTAVLEKIFTVSKTKAATPAKTLTLTATSQLFQISKLGVVSPASITFTAFQNSLAGTPVFSVSGTGASVTSTPGTNVCTLTYTGMAANETVVVTATQDGYTDTITIVKVREGVDTITGFLTNEAANVPADSTGTVSSYTGTGGTYNVYQGITDKTGNATVTYSVVSSANVTVTIAATGVYTVSALTADYGTALLRAVFGGVTVDKVYSISKARAGTPGVGLNGIRGSRTFYVTLTGTTATYSDSLATTTATADGGPVMNDVVTQYNTSKGFSQTKFYDITNSVGSWSIVNAVVDGNLLVSGTIGATAMQANIMSSDNVLTKGLTVRDLSGNIILSAGSNLDYTKVGGTTKPADNATVGAPAGTLVNGVAVGTLTDNAANGASAYAAVTSSTSGLATKLKANAQNVLSGAGGLTTGSLVVDTAGSRTSGYGLGFTQKGLAAFNSAGEATFVLNGTTGDASFAGTVSAGGVEVGKDVGPGAGHFGLSLSPDNFNDIFIKRDDGVKFFRVNEGGTNYLTFDSSSGVLAIKGELRGASGTFSGSLTASAINAVSTINIAGQAVTAPAYVSNNTSDITLVYTLTGEAGAAYSVFILVGLTGNASTMERFSINGVQQWQESVATGTILSKGIVVSLVPGTYTFRAWMDNTSNTGASIYALATKR